VSSTRRAAAELLYIYEGRKLWFDVCRVNRRSRRTGGRTSTSATSSSGEADIQVPNAAIRSTSTFLKKSPNISEIYERISELLFGALFQGFRGPVARPTRQDSHLLRHHGELIEDHVIQKLPYLEVLWKLSNG
jgi:hypothetical protein